MDGILEPLLAILVIFAPLGMAYVILVLQSRKRANDYRKEFVISGYVLMRQRAEIFRAEEKNTAR